MIEKNILLIVASGKSSRFGGFPKAFCQLGKETNAENTIRQAKKFYDKVYIGVNRETYGEYYRKIKGCVMFSIITGHGDAHSLLKCLIYIKEHEKYVNRVTVCWGDAVFVDDLPFKELIENTSENKVSVACALDEKPYAWFEVNKANEILKSHFARDGKTVDQGLHDQSLFLFDFEFALKYLDEYRKFLGIPKHNEVHVIDKDEMKLLHSFEFLYKSGYERAICVTVTSDKVFSFNTQEELEIIKRKIK